VAPERRTRVIVREVLIAFGLLLTFMFVGDALPAADEPQRTCRCRWPAA
jgi:hypothetical protein